MNHKTKRFWILLVSSFLVIMNLSNVNANGSEPQSSPTEITDKVTVLETLLRKKERDISGNPYPRAVVLVLEKLLG